MRINSIEFRSKKFLGFDRIVDSFSLTLKKKQKSSMYRYRLQFKIGGNFVIVGRNSKRAEFALVGQLIPSTSIVLLTSLDPETRHPRRG